MRRERGTSACLPVAIEIVLAVLQCEAALRERRTAPDPDVHRRVVRARARIKDERIFGRERGRICGLDLLERDLARGVGEPEESFRRGGRC